MTSASRVSQGMPALAGGIASALAASRRTLCTLRLWQQRARQRAALSELDDRILADIGLTREQVREETRKPFWRP